MFNRATRSKPLYLVKYPNGSLHELVLMEAESEEGLRNQLYLQGIAGFKISRFARERLTMKPEEFLQWLDDLCMLLKAKLSLVDAVSSLLESSRSFKHRSLAKLLLRELKMGKTFDSFAKRFEVIFPPLFVPMIAVAHTSGNIEELLGYYREYLFKQLTLKKKIKKELSYPLVLLVVAIAILMLFLFAVIPSFEQLFEDLGNGSKKWIFAVSRFVRTHVVLFSISISTTIAFGFIFRKQLYLQALKMSEVIKPLFDLIKQAEVLRFVEVMHLLLRSHLPFHQALGLSIVTSSHPKFKSEIQTAYRNILRGASLRGAFEKTSWLPPFAKQSLSLLTASGESQASFAQMEHYLRYHFESKMSKILALLQPCLLILLAGMILWLLLTLLMPLTDMSHFF